MREEDLFYKALSKHTSDGCINNKNAMQTLQLTCCYASIAWMHILIFMFAIVVPTVLLHGVKVMTAKRMPMPNASTKVRCGSIKYFAGNNECDVQDF